MLTVKNLFTFLYDASVVVAAMFAVLAIMLFLYNLDIRPSEWLMTVGVGCACLVGLMLRRTIAALP